MSRDYCLACPWRTALTWLTQRWRKHSPDWTPLDEDTP